MFGYDVGSVARTATAVVVSRIRSPMADAAGRLTKSRTLSIDRCCNGWMGDQSTDEMNSVTVCVGRDDANL